MVDAIGIEKLSHVLESAYPPGTTVAQHLVPVVRRKAPVLAIHREIVGRCTGLSIEMEVFRFGPHIATVAINTDGNVAFQYDTLGASMLMGPPHLSIKQILNEIMESHLSISLGRRRGERFAFGLVPGVVIRPTGEVGSAVLIAQMAVLRIGHEPMCLFLEKGFEVVALHQLLSLLEEKQT